jgi:tripartite ATP-independent transporter DctM subunit
MDQPAILDTGTVAPPTDYGSGAIDRANKLLAYIGERVALIAVVAVLLIAFANVTDIVLRNFFAISLYGLNEINTLLVAIAVATCLPHGFARNAPLRIDAFSGSLPKSAGAWLSVFGAAAMLLFFAIVAWRMGAAAATMERNNETTVMMEVAKAPFFYGVALAIGFAALVQAGMMVAAVRDALALSGSWGWAALAAILLFVGWTGAVLAGWASGAPAYALAPSGSLALALVAFALMWVVILATVPLGAAMGLTGIIGTAALLGAPISMEVLGAEASSYITRDALSVLPLFLLMGAFATLAGIGSDLYRLFYVLVGHVRGGLAHASILACAGFGTLTGSSVATQMSIGKIALKEMRDRGYSQELAAGSIAAGGTLGQLIPPSSALIVYAVMTEESVGQLFVGALIPGILAAILYMCTVAVWLTILPHHATKRDGGRSTVAELVQVSGATWAALLLLGVVLSGIYFGFFTDLEAGSVGAAGAFLLALVRGKINPKTFFKSMGETTITLSMMYSLIFGVIMLSFFFGIANLPQTFVAWVNSFGMAPIMVVICLVACYLILGTVMDEFAMMVITIPIFVPLVVSLGYDPIWWGVLTMLCMSAGAISPPFGINMFIISALDARIPITRVYAGCWPFFGSAVVKIFLLIAFPALVTWLPSTM